MCLLSSSSSSVSFCLAAVVFVRVTEQLAGAGRARLAQVLFEMPVGNLPGVSELRGGADGVGSAQARGHGRFEGQGVLAVAAVHAGVVVEVEVGLRDVAEGRRVAGTRDGAPG